MSKETKLECPECGGSLFLRDSRYGKFYGCENFPRCKATHGAHPDGRPLGTPGDELTKALRMNVHDLMEQVFGSWDSVASKKKMYHWLRQNSSTGHIGSTEKEELLHLQDRLKGMANRKQFS